MAIKGKGDGQTVKEKRGTSPYPRHSDPRPAAAAAQRRRSPTPAAAATTLSDHKSTATAQKQVPNYLKPTKSSTHDPSKPSPKKQPFTDFTTPKTSPLTRRRSFDKPPSPSRIPKPNATSPNSAEKSLRSSSFSSKTTPLPKTQFEKLSKATKEPIRASNARKSIVTNSKKQNGASSSPRTSTSKATRASSPDRTITDNSLKLELQHKDEESPPTDAAAEINDQKLPAEIIQLEEDHKEHVNADVVNEAEMDESEELEHCYSCTVPEDHNASLPVDMEESQGETPSEENVNNHQEVDQESSKEESVGSHRQPQGITATANEPEVDGEKKEGGKEETASALAMKENSSELKEKVKKIKEVPMSEEAAPVERVAKGSNKPGEAEIVVKKIQGVSGNGKKDTAAYNDVIEETASKLRELRKNKVKALVGAFETVISLESDATAE